MSKKRASAESNSNDEQPNEGSDSDCRQEDNAKRAKLTLLSDTTLQDLPMELLECILVKAVVLEVKGLKLVKSTWKEKADLVITRLETVCSHWSSVLTTDIFRKEVNRILDGTAQPTIRLEILHQSPIHLEISTTKLRREIFATMKDEMFMLSRPKDEDFAINIHDRNNMAEVKDVIPLPGTRPVDIAACTKSNCVYVLNYASNCISVLRITKGEEHQFNISPWIRDPRLSHTLPTLSVSANGSLVIHSTQPGILPNRSVASICLYDANGSLQHELMLSSSIYGFRFVYGVIQKSNGNIVLASSQDYELRIDLREIDTSGRIVRQYQSSFRSCSGLGIADIYDRIVIACGDRFELLDSEFNLMAFADSRPLDERSDYFTKLHYNSDRNEISRLRLFMPHHTRALTILRFTEE